MYSPISLKIRNMISFEGEQSYEFRKGEAIVVTGKNHDNPSQAVNGTGKSALIESIAVAFTGTSIRDVKAKELINRRSKDGEVELVLTNPKLNHNLTIWRKIYAGSKSAECRIWINDDEVRLSDINSYNKFIFDQIGLTKDDFFNFFLLVQANYSPFLRVGDTKKKEIINRFSGADNVDTLIPLVKRDLDLFDPEFEEVNKKIGANTAKIEVIDGQIEELKRQESFWDLEKEEQIATHDANKLKLRLDMKNAWEAAFGYLQTARVYKDEQANFNADYRVELLQLVKKEKEERRGTIKQHIDELKVEISKVKDLPVFKKRIDAINLKEKTLNQQIKDNKEVLQEYQKYKADLEKQLHDAIECPSCHHEFSLKNKDFDPKEAKDQIPDIDKEIKATEKLIKDDEKTVLETLHQDKMKVNEDITAKKAKLQETIDSYSKEWNKLQAIINHCTSFSKKLTDKDAEYERNIKAKVQNGLTERSKVHRAQITYNGINDEIEKLENKDFNAEIAAKETEKKKYSKALTEASKEFDELTVTRQAVAEWETNFKNFKSFIANQSIKNIEDYTNLFLQQMGSDLGIKLDGYTTLASKKIKEQISTNVLRGGFDEGSYGAFSGGERGRIDICVIIAIQQLINLNCPSGGLDLLICDEILDQIDALGLESIINSLQNLDRTIMIVSQNEINTLKKYTLLIEKRNKISKFVA